MPRRRAGNSCTMNFDVAIVGSGLAGLTVALQLALRHGTIAVRAQCHLDPEIGLKHIEALLAVKEQVASWMTLQIVAFPQSPQLEAVKTRRRARSTAAPDAAGTAAFTRLG